MYLHFLWKCVLVWASLCLNLQIQVLYKISRKSINTFWSILCKWDCKLFGIKFKVAFKKCGTSLGALCWSNLRPYEKEYGAQSEHTNQSPVEPPPGGVTPPLLNTSSTISISTVIFWLLLSATTLYHYLFASSSTTIFACTIFRIKCKDRYWMNP